MKILLLGGTGFIGSRLGARLVEQGCDVTIMSRVAPASPLPGVRYLTSSLDNTALLRSLLPDCAHVFHLASSTTPGSSRLDPAAEISANLQPLSRLLESLQECPDTHLTFVSSGGAIYGDPPSGQLVDETAAASPISYYGAAKAASEAFLHAYHRQTGNAVTVLRPANVYGPGQSAKIGFGIIPTLLSCAAHQRPFELWGDGEIVRDYLYIDDFAALCLQIVSATQHPRRYRVFNVGSGQGHSIIGLCGYVEEITNRTLELIHRPARGIDVHRIVLDSTAAFVAFDWKARTALIEGLRRTWEAMADESSGCQ